MRSPCSIALVWSSKTSATKLRKLMLKNVLRSRWTRKCLTFAWSLSTLEQLRQMPNRASNVGREQPYVSSLQVLSSTLQHQWGRSVNSTRGTHWCPMITIEIVSYLWREPQTLWAETHYARAASMRASALKMHMMTQLLRIWTLTQEKCSAFLMWTKKVKKEFKAKLSDFMFMS